MKAPDKIYVAESLIKTLYGNGWSPTPYTSRENTEYIRKDALLKWAQDFKARTGWYEIEVAMDDLIDKLNSM